MKLTSNKDLRSLLRDAEQNGWTFSRKRKHIKGVRADGKIVTLGTTPSDWRALKNMQRDLR
jgi:hypothetical protein